MKYIFISYSRKDAVIVDRLAARLRDEDYVVSIDRESIKGGEIWLTRLAHEIEVAEVVILVLSANSAASANVQKEIYVAHEANKDIVPVKLEPLTIPQELKIPLGGIQSIDFAADFEDGLRRLLASLRNTNQTTTGTAIEISNEDEKRIQSTLQDFMSGKPGSFKAYLQTRADAQPTDSCLRRIEELNDREMVLAQEIKNAKNRRANLLREKWDLPLRNVSFESQVGQRLLKEIELLERTFEVLSQELEDLKKERDTVQSKYEDGLRAIERYKRMWEIYALERERAGPDAVWNEQAQGFAAIWAAIRKDRRR